MATGSVISRPTKADLRLDTSDEELSEQEEGKDATNNLEQKLKEKHVDLCKLGITFIMENLIHRYKEDERRTAMKRDRFEKWVKMVSFGLAQEL